MLSSGPVNECVEPPLTLVLYPNAMDVRRLHCLVVGGNGKYHEVHVSGRDMRVVALQFKLSDLLGGGLCANDLELFLARPPEGSGREWLTDRTLDASELAYANASRLHEVASAFIADRNLMLPMSLLHSHFPLQPSLYDGRLVAIHVLVVIPKLLLPSPSPPLSPLMILDEEQSKKKEKEPGKLAALMQNWMKLKIELVGLRSRNGKTVLPQLMRCLAPGSRLWLDDTDEDRALTEIYVPTSWRLLRDAVLSWLEDPLDDIDAPLELWGKGKRVLLTGAPRIGKSVFLIYALICIVRSKSSPVCIVDIPGVTFSLIDRKKGIVIDGQRGKDFAEELADAFTVYLFDTNAALPDARPLAIKQVDARSIIISSRLFTPLSTRRSKTLVLPQWSIEDVRNCVKLWAPGLVSSEFEALYHKWGGIPGRFLIDLPAASSAELENTLGKLKPSKVAKALMAMANTSTNGWSAFANGPDAELWKPLIVFTSNASSDTFEHDGQIAFTSQFVCDRVMELLTMSTRAIGQYEQPKLSRLWGQIRTSLAYLAREEEEKTSEPPRRVALFPKPKSKSTYTYWT